MTKKESYGNFLIKKDEQIDLMTSQFFLETNLEYRSFLNWQKRLAEPASFVELIVAKPIDITCGDLSLNVDLELTSLSRVILSLNLATLSC